MVIQFVKTLIALTLVVPHCHALICLNTSSLPPIAQATEAGLLNVKLVQPVTAWDKMKTSADFLLRQRAGTVAGIGRSFIESLWHGLVAQTPGFLCLRDSGDAVSPHPGRSLSTPEGFLRSLTGHENSKLVFSASVIL